MAETNAARLLAWAGRFAVGLAAVSLVELFLAEALPAAGQAVDLFVLLVVLNGLAGNSLHGMAGGLVAGFVQDTLSMSPVGLHALACCVVGYAMARLSQRIVTSQHVTVSLLVAVGVLVHQAIVLGLLALLAGVEPGGGAAVPLRVAATTAVGVPALWLVGRLRVRAAVRLARTGGRGRQR